MLRGTKSSESELRSIFLKYATEEDSDENDGFDEPHSMTLSSLQQMANDYVLPVSSNQIRKFFSINNNIGAKDGSYNSRIDFIEFAQFVRHQESTVKKLFTNFNYHEKDVCL